MNYSRELLEEVLQTSLSRGGEYADIFIERSTGTTVYWDAGALRTVHTGMITGAGIRVITGGSYLYVYASSPDTQRLRTLACEARDAVSSNHRGSFQPLQETPHTSYPSIKQYPGHVSLGEKLEYVKRADAAARDYSSFIQDAVITYQDTDQEVVIAGSDGRYVQDRRVRTKMGVQSLASDGSQQERGFFSPGRSMGLEYFQHVSPEETARESARIACTLLDADSPPQGPHPVIISHELGGVIFHEACGHALEAAHIAKGASVFGDRLNKKIASGKVSAFDDGTIAHGWGSSAFDDEGEPMQKTQLIKRGRLVSFISDRLGSIKTGHPMTGNGRRESYRYAPSSRMSNTYIAPGKASLDDMLSSLGSGLYCRRMGGGSVHPSNSEFNFSVHEAYLVKDGVIDRPVKGASLIGKGTEILRRIEMVGNDLIHGSGMCGSSSGSIPAGIGQPTLFVSGIVIGGRS